MLARAPASSANLGPGFDVLGLALDCHVEVTVEPAPMLSVTADGEGSHLPRDAGHLAARVAAAVAGSDRLAIRVRSDIPVSRGLGSSAALALAAAAAAGAPDPLAVAAAVDGHPENAAASYAGGLVAAVPVDGEIVTVPLGVDPRLAVVAVVPDVGLATTAARAVLPPVVDRRAATANLGRMAMLLAGLADLDRMRPEATEDHLHQDARTVLFPKAPAILDALVAAGALAACWSGAGPTMIGFSTRADVAEVRRRTMGAVERLDLRAQVVVVHPDLEGLVTGPEAHAEPDGERAAS